jgi:hypothetical protein
MMQEYGSFFELDLRQGCEYYLGRRVKCLNTARSGILYALRLMGCKKILIPVYQCGAVAEFLTANGIHVSYFSVDGGLLPVLPRGLPGGTALLIVNYFGLIPRDRLKSFVARYKNFIIDNSQAFYSLPLKGAYNVYSPRKFFGVPDGCYVVGERAGSEDFAIEDDYSADSSLFLLKRLEAGCEAAYEGRQINEARLAACGIRNMSMLTKKLLAGIDYEYIKNKRKENFDLSLKLYSGMNLLDLSKFAVTDPSAVPMVYPLVVRNEEIAGFLQQNKIFIGRWWAHLKRGAAKNSMETLLSKYMLPLPVDQRMNKEDIIRIHDLIEGYLKKTWSDNVERKDILIPSPHDRTRI